MSEPDPVFDAPLPPWRPRDGIARFIADSLLDIATEIHRANACTPQDLRAAGLLILQAVEWKVLDKSQVKHLPGHGICYSREMQNDFVGVLIDLAGTVSPSALAARPELANDTTDAVLRHIVAHPGCRLQDIADGVGKSVPTIKTHVRILEDRNELAPLPPGRERRTMFYPKKKSRD